MSGNYCRKGASIADYDNKDKNGNPHITEFDSIALAKKESKRLQLAKDGALGRGCLYLAK